MPPISSLLVHVYKEHALYTSLKNAPVSSQDTENTYNRKQRNFTCSEVLRQIRKEKRGEEELNQQTLKYGDIAITRLVSWTWIEVVLLVDVVLGDLWVLRSCISNGIHKQETLKCTHTNTYYGGDNFARGATSHRPSTYQFFLQALALNIGYYNSSTFNMAASIDRVHFKCTGRRISMMYDKEQVQKCCREVR